MSAKFDRLLNEKLEELKIIVPTLHTLKEVCEYLGYSAHGRNTSKLSIFLKANLIDYSHFRTSGFIPKNIIECVCPVCGIIFGKNINNVNEAKKTTCSHACGNIYFKDKQQYGRHKGEGFANKWKYHQKLEMFYEKHNLVKKCVVCDEEEILDCHHIDEDKNNDDLSNLVFLCPTHHMAIHRYNSDTVFQKIADNLDYRDSLK